MSGRRLVCINHAGDAGVATDGTDHVVLDPSWTPAPGERADLLPIRGPVWEVIRERNLHDESLAALDAWASAAGLVGRFEVRGVSWWAHVRSFLRLDLHELMAWRLLLDRIAPSGRYESIEVPIDRPLLRAALEAHGVAAASPPEIIVTEVGTEARRFGGGKPSKAVTGSGRPWYRRMLSRTARMSRRTLDLPARARARLLRERFGRLVRRRPEVLAVVRGESFHLVVGAEGEGRSDPIVTPVLQRLEARGRTATVVVLGSTGEEDVALLRQDGPMPIGALTRMLVDRRERADDRGDYARRLAGVESVPLPIDGADLSPALVAVLASLEKWLARQQRERLVAERLISTLRPRVLLTGWEAARTAWLAAARSSGVPSVAIQHGVIYPNNPDYYRPVLPELVRPDLTCVFGAYEQRMLAEECGYAPDAVIATGSPRATPSTEAPRPEAGERAEVRRGLGIADGDRMLVISAARHAVQEGLHSTTIFGRLLDGPLPGVHIVIKLHPEEEQGDQYPTLIAGMALAGGYPEPPVTVVRDIDLFHLLRAADAHLGIYSTVLTDAVVAGTPNMIAMGQAWSDLLGYVAAGVAQPVSSVDDVRAFMRDPRPATAEARVAFLREHYEPGDGADRIADAVIRVAERPRRRTGSRLTPAHTDQPLPFEPGTRPDEQASGAPTLERKGGA